MSAPAGPGDRAYTRTGRPGFSLRCAGPLRAVSALRAFPLNDLCMPGEDRWRNPHIGRLPLDRLVKSEPSL